MTDFLIYGVDHNGKRKQVALTTSARAAKTYRERQDVPWEKIVVTAGDEVLTIAELDRLSEAEDRLGMRF